MVQIVNFRLTTLMMDNLAYNMAADSATSVMWHKNNFKFMKTKKKCQGRLATSHLPPATSSEEGNRDEPPLPVFPSSIIIIFNSQVKRGGGGKTNRGFSTRPRPSPVRSRKVALPPMEATEGPWQPSMEVAPRVLGLEEIKYNYVIVTRLMDWNTTNKRDINGSNAHIGHFSLFFQ